MSNSSLSTVHYMAMKTWFATRLSAAMPKKSSYCRLPSPFLSSSAMNSRISSSCKNSPKDQEAKKEALCVQLCTLDTLIVHARPLHAAWMLTLRGSSSSRLLSLISSNVMDPLLSLSKNFSRKTSAFVSLLMKYYNQNAGGHK